mgnify:CR=1 FL=1
MIKLRAEEEKKRFEMLDAWFSSEHGQRAADVIREEIVNIRSILVGNKLIQLGSCGRNPWLSQLQYQNKWIIKPHQDNSRVSHCHSLLTQLPIDKESVDCVLAPFTIDAFSSKESILDEMDRILKPMGYLVIIGINPYSLWGAWLRFNKSAYFGKLHGFPRSLIHIKCMLQNYGYQQCFAHDFYFIPPVQNPTLIQSLSFLNQVGKMVSLLPSAFYCVVFQKYVINYIQPLLVANQKELLKTSPLYQPSC